MSPQDDQLTEKLLGEELPLSESNEIGNDEEEDEKDSLRKESHVRSLLKGISYRVIETFVTFGISYYVTGDITSALQIGVIEFFVQIVVYYFHERCCTCVKV